VAALVRAYANLAPEMTEAGFDSEQAAAVKNEVDHYEKVRTEVKLASADYIDLKMYEPAMRHLIDAYIRAEDSKKVSAFDEMPLVDLIVERGADAVQSLPDGIKTNQAAVAETIENNVRKLIIDESPVNPKYYDKMSVLLDELVAQRRREAINYREYLEKIVELAKKLKNPTIGAAYPKSLNTASKRALFDNLDKNETLALAADQAVRDNAQAGWRQNIFKIRKVKNALRAALGDCAGRTDDILEIVKAQHDY
jgi:type I restriction enzyme, R subunit